MATCYLCRRDDLAVRPLMPVAMIGALVSHAKADGTPCAASAPATAYDAELHAVIVENDDLWDLGPGIVFEGGLVHPGPAPEPEQEVVVITIPLPEPPTFEPTPRRRRGPKKP